MGRGSIRSRGELGTNACWVLVEVLHAMAIVAIIMAVVRHVGSRLDRSWLGELGRFDYFKRVERLDRSTLACPVAAQGGAVKSELAGMRQR